MLIERVPNLYPNYLVRCPARSKTPKNRPAVLLLHGFPAGHGTKNLDIALSLTEALDLTSYVFHYPGLGESYGEFGFKKSIRMSEEMLALLAKEMGHKEIILFGHSWGGMVVCNLAPKFPDRVTGILLASPLCDLFTTDPIYQWLIHGVRAEQPWIRFEKNPLESEEELKQVLAQHLPRHQLSHFATSQKIELIQAVKDDLTPRDRAIQLCQEFSTVSYRELDQDHSFSENKPAFIQEVIASVRRLIA